MFVTSSVRRISKRRGVARKFRKFEKNKDLNQKLPPKINSIFCPKLGEGQKKRSSLKFSPVFCPNVGASLKETHKTYPLCNQTLCPTCKGGPCLNFVYHSMQLYNPGDPKGGPWPNGPSLNTPLFITVLV